MAIALSELKEKKSVDYIAAWFWNGAKYIENTRARYAFVSTNSISQGEQVGMLWPHIFNKGLEIFFARTSFKWENNAKHNAAVICMIIGVSNKYDGVKLLYNETTNECHRVKSINPYLSADSNVIVSKSARPQEIPPMFFGSMPRDGGFLNYTEEEVNDLITCYPHAKPIVKKYIGSQEFLQGIMRYCLWIEDENKELAYSIPPIVDRLSSVKAMRESSDASSTRDYANRPYMFVQRAYQPTDAIIVPAVSSERREYIPIGFVDKDTVISNLAFAVYDAELWLFGMLTSKMHNVWVRTVGGRLKTDYRYSATLCYNTFPFPKINDEQKAKLTALAENIIYTRERHTEMTYGEMYNPESMPLDLKYAHQAMDIAVEQCYRPEPFTSDEERLEYLFKLYEKMTKKK